MEEDAVGEVPADAACEGLSFTIAAKAEEVFGVVEVFGADDFLLDDGAFIEVGGDVVAGGTDEFYSAFPGTLVGVGPHEGGEEGVVDVHDAAFPALADCGGDDLHVAGEDDEVGTGVALDALHFEKCGVFIRGAHGDVVERQSLALDGGAEVFVVPDDAGDIASQFARPPAPEEVGKAVSKARDHDDSAHFIGLAPDAPVRMKLGGKRRKFSTQVGERETQCVALDGHAGEEPTGLCVGKLVDFVEVAAVFRDECGDAGEEADAVGAGEF